jgi:hypothetical protein
MTRLETTKENLRRAKHARNELARATRTWQLLMRERREQNALASSFTHTDTELAQINTAYSSVQGPLGFVKHSSGPLGLNNRFKSVHHVHIAQSDIIRWLTGFTLSGDAYRTMCALSNMLRQVHKRSSSPEHRAAVYKLTTDYVCYLEEMLPVTMHSRMLHGYCELALGSTVYGQGDLYWMFGFERWPHP